MENTLNANVTIRRETPDDYRTVETLVRDAFWNVYRPGAVEHFLIHELRSNPNFIPELDIVLEKDGVIVGQSCGLSEELRRESDGATLRALEIGPICVAASLQRQGYGKVLLDKSIEIAASLGYDAICLEGNIDFYGKSGFVVASTRGVRYNDEPADDPVPYFLVRELRPGALDAVPGCVWRTPKVYFVDDAQVEAFDATFPPKEKLRLPGQIF